MGDSFYIVFMGSVGVLVKVQSAAAGAAGGTTTHNKVVGVPSTNAGAVEKSTNMNINGEEHPKIIQSNINIGSEEEDSSKKKESKETTTSSDKFPPPSSSAARASCIQSVSNQAENLSVTWRTEAYLGAGMSFGELALHNNRPRAATIWTTEQTELLVIKKHDFQAYAGASHKKFITERTDFLRACVGFPRAFCVLGGEKSTSTVSSESSTNVCAPPPLGTSGSMRTVSEASSALRSSTDPSEVSSAVVAGEKSTNSEAANNSKTQVEIGAALTNLANHLNETQVRGRQVVALQHRPCDKVIFVRKGQLLVLREILVKDGRVISSNINEGSTTSSTSGTSSTRTSSATGTTLRSRLCEEEDSQNLLAEEPGGTSMWHWVERLEAERSSSSSNAAQTLLNTSPTGSSSKLSLRRRSLPATSATNSSNYTQLLGENKKSTTSTIDGGKQRISRKHSVFFEASSTSEIEDALTNDDFRSPSAALARTSVFGGQGYAYGYFDADKISVQTLIHRAQTCPVDKATGARSLLLKIGSLGPNQFFGHQECLGVLILDFFFVSLVNVLEYEVENNTFRAWTESKYIIYIAREIHFDFVSLRSCSTRWVLS